MPEINKKTLRNIFIIVIAGIVAYWILHETERAKNVYHLIRGIVFPFALGSGLAFIINVPMRAIEKILKGIKHVKIRRVIAIALTFLALALVVALVCLLLIPQLVNTVESLIPTVQNFVRKIETGIGKFLQNYPSLTKWVVDNTDIENLDWANIAQRLIAVVSSSITTIVGGAFSAIDIISGAILDILIAVVFAVYALFQKETLARQGRKMLYAFLPEKISDYIIHVLRLSNAAFSNFLSGQCVEMLILGSLLAIAMAIFRMPYIPLICVLVSITAFIPYVGSFVGCFIGGFLILVTNPMQAVWFVLLFVIVQGLENNLIYPKVVGDSVGLSGMWVLVAIAVGGELMGVVGMILLIPVASVIHTLLQEYTNKRLSEISIDPEKLKAQPLDFRSKYKEKRELKKEKRVEKTESAEENTED